MNQPSPAATPKPDAPEAVHAAVLQLLHGERGRLLDVPAGEGALAAAAQRAGFEVACGDLEPARFCAPGLRCEQVDLNARWPYADGQFDVLVSIEAVEHLENPWHMVREAYRILKPGGAAIITTPNVLSLRSRLSYLLYGYPNYFHYMVETNGAGGERVLDHINPVGFLELRHIVARCGFRIEAVETNRYLKRRSPLYQLLRAVLATRGQRHVAGRPDKAGVRDLLLSDPVLFGENLVLKARRPKDRA